MRERVTQSRYPDMPPTLGVGARTYRFSKARAMSAGRNSPKENNMQNRNRRKFLADVGKGMLLASVGPALAAELRLTPSLDAEGAERLTFGDREPLVALMQDTPVGKL